MVSDLNYYHYVNGLLKFCLTSTYFKDINTQFYFIILISDHICKFIQLNQTKTIFKLNDHSWMYFLDLPKVTSFQYFREFMKITGGSGQLFFLSLKDVY